VVLRDAGDLEIGLITALRHGAGVETLRTIGTGLGGAVVDVERVLAALEPAFEPRPDGSPAVGAPAGSRAESPRAPAGSREARESRVVMVDADGVLRERLIADLTALGYQASTPPSADGASGHDERAANRTALSVVAATWAIPPARHLPWLRRDVPHLAVVFDDTGVRVGPLVEPGDGPCLRCLDLARRDADSAWPAIAAQLTRRPAATYTLRAALDAAALAAAIVDDRIVHGATGLAAASVTLGRWGALPRRRRHDPHPECGCRAPGGTATAPVRLDDHRPSATSSAKVGVAPA